MSLTDTAIRKAKPGEKTRKIFDEKGLYLEISPTGRKGWRHKYRFNGKEKRLSYGVYPDVSLKQARERRDQARRQLAEGIDPSVVRKAQKAASRFDAANSFESVARDWFETKKSGWAKTHSGKLIRRLEMYVFPDIGKEPISSITAPRLLEVIRKIADQGTGETAHRTLQICGRVFRYANQSGISDNDPSACLKGALPPVKPGHFAAVTEPDDLAPILRAIDNYEGARTTPVVYAALRLTPMLLVRPGELRHAQWEDIDLVKAEWRFTASKTKTPHIVPLPRQAVAILLSLCSIVGDSPYVFPNPRSRKGNRPISENAVLTALRTIGIPKDIQTAHGFRATGRTILAEIMGYPPEVIEQQIAHQQRDPLGRAYNRTTYLDERTRMMQDWADYLDKLKAGGGGNERATISVLGKGRKAEAA